MVHRTKSGRQTQKLGFDLGRKLKNGSVVLLYGELGAGKTTFIQGIARGLGIKQRINSPTFIIARRYKLKNNFFFHVDLYRLASLEEVKKIGLEEMVGKNVVCIEWPELVEQIIPASVKVKLTALNENERQVEIIY